ncbi:MAG: ferrous iron transport protein A [Polyangiaceae bacterium]|nr:ferrous iron transport protein A [Polyangiaceae bacterium]
MTLDTAHIGEHLRIQQVAGERAFRRRLLELGLVPGTRVELKRIAPLGDPIELLVRGCSLSIRRAEARSIHVTRETAAESSARPVASCCDSSETLKLEEEGSAA